MEVCLFPIPEDGYLVATDGFVLIVQGLCDITDEVDEEL